MLTLAADSSRQWKVARIVRLSHSEGTTTCESCQYSSDSSDTGGHSDHGEDEAETMTSSGDSLGDLEIPVRVGGCEKWVTGLTRRTTCDDVIYAIMSHDNTPEHVLDVQTYVMYERWREVERPLKGRTKILKVWRAWGSENRNVRLFIRKDDNPYESSSEVSRTRRPRKHHPSHQVAREGGHRRTARDTGSSRRDSQPSGSRHHHRSRHRPEHESDRRRPEHESDRRRHRVRTSERRQVTLSYVTGDVEAIPSCAKYPEDPCQPQSRDRSKGHAFHQMVQVILDQERRLQDQTSRIKDVDQQIDSHQTREHLVRMEANGRNYVQDAYMRDRSDESSSCEDSRLGAVVCTPLTLQEQDRYSELCEEILQLQQRISSEEDRIQDLTTQIFSESQLAGDSADNHSLASNYTGEPGKPLRAALPGSFFLPPPGGDSGTESAEIRQELARMRAEIERSARLSLAQQKQLQQVDRTLRECETQLGWKRQLLSELTDSRGGEPVTRKTREWPQDCPRSYPAPALNKHKSKSCESISCSPLSLPPTSTDHTMFRSRDVRAQYSSDSGAESLADTKSDRSRETSDCSKDSQDLSSEDAAVSATHIRATTMVPYYTYATYDKDTSDRKVASKSAASDDSNSDTGMSSLHSDDPTPVLETLV